MGKKERKKKKSDVHYFHYKRIEVPFDDELRLNRLFSKDTFEFVTHSCIKKGASVT